MYTREELIELCEAAIVSQELWSHRDSAQAQIGIGNIWALLKSGCSFKVLTKHNHESSCVTDEDTIWVQFYVKDFEWVMDVIKDTPKGNKGEYLYYLPTKKRIIEANGKDWY